MGSDGGAVRYTHHASWNSAYTLMEVRVHTRIHACTCACASSQPAFGSHSAHWETDWLALVQLQGLWACGKALLGCMGPSMGRSHAGTSTLLHAFGASSAFACTTPSLAPPLLSVHVTRAMMAAAGVV